MVSQTHVSAMLLVLVLFDFSSTVCFSKSGEAATLIQVLIEAAEEQCVFASNMYLNYRLGRPPSGMPELSVFWHARAAILGGEITRFRTFEVFFG